MPKKPHALFPLLLLSLSLLAIQPAAGREAVPPKEIFVPAFFAQPYRPPAWVGPDGGAVAALAFNPRSPAEVYAGTWGAGVFKSRDGGYSWFPASEGLENPVISALAVAPLDPAVVYAGTYKGGLYKSTDAGQSWFPSGAGIQEEAIVYAIAIDPHNPAAVYAATRGRSNNGRPPWNGVIYKSSDGGGRWTPALYNLAGSDEQDWAYDLVVNPARPSVLYAATHEHGIYRSRDYGETWKAANDGITNLSTRAAAVDPDSGDPATVYAAVWTRDGVFKSSDGGDTWRLSSDGITGAQIYSLALDPFDPRRLFAATFNRGVMLSPDGAVSWQASSPPQFPASIVRTDPRDGSLTLAGTYWNGLIASRDRGLSWQPSQTGLRASSPTGFLVAAYDPNAYFAATYGDGVAWSDDRGRTWYRFSHELGDLFLNGLVQSPDGRILYALTESGGLYAAEPAARSWWEKVPVSFSMASALEVEEAAAHPLRDRSDFYDPFRFPDVGVRAAGAAASPALLSMAFAPSDPDIAYLGTDGTGAYRSADGGAGWAPAGLDGRPVYSLAVDPTDPGLVYAATGQAGVVRVSPDGGRQWLDLALPGAAPYALALSPAQPGALYAGTSSGVYRTVEGAFVPSGLQGLGVPAIAAHPSRPGVVLAAGPEGAYISLDGGLSWTPGPEELAGKTVQTIGFDPFDDHLAYFGTRTHGVLRVQIP